MRKNCPNPNDTFEIGIISDTHGPLDRRVPPALAGVGAIIHAGDIVDESVLFFLNEIASVTAVRGNMDGYGAPGKLPKTAVLEIDETFIYVVHDLTRMDLDPRAAGLDVVVHGHTHRPEIVKKGGVLYVNPGSAGAPRYNHKSTVARLTIGKGKVSARIVVLS